jgi:hypothetical protein
MIFSFILFCFFLAEIINIYKYLIYGKKTIADLIGFEPSNRIFSKNALIPKLKITETDIFCRPVNPFIEFYKFSKRKQFIVYYINNTCLIVNLFEFLTYHIFLLVLIIIFIHSV